MTDIGIWPKNMSKYVDYWINKGIPHLQNCDEELIKEKSFVQKSSTGKWIRKCNTGMFKQKKKSYYYSLSIALTPDEGHVDQLTIVFDLWKALILLKDF